MQGIRGSVMSHREFRLLWVGATTSALGDRVYEIALMWYVLRTTGSVLETASVEVVRSTALLVFGLFAGTVADRLARRVLMIGGDLVRAGIVLVTAVLVIMSALPLWYVDASTFLLTATGLVYDPASVAMLPGLVGENRLLQANAYLAGASRLIQFAGRGIGGVAVAAFGAFWGIAGNAASYCVSAVCTFFVKFPPQATPDKALAPAAFLRETWRGITFLSRDYTLRSLIIISMAANIGGGLTSGIAPAFADRQLDGNAAIYGFILTALSLGEFAGMSLIGALGNRLSMSRTLAFSLVLGGAIYIFVSLTHSWHLAVMLFALEGFAIAIGNLPIRTLLQTSTPNEIRGRVFSGFITAVNAGSPLATFLGALLAGSFGLPVVYATAGITVTSAGCWAGWRLRQRQPDTNSPDTPEPD